MIQRFWVNYLLGILVLLFFGSTNLLQAQTSLGATSVAMGQTGVAIPNGNWSIFSNVALMPTDEKHISFYGFRYVGIAEITDMAVNMITPTNVGTIGIGVHRYGFNLFNENRFLLAYKNNLERFHYGASVSYTHIFQGGDYGAAGAIGFDIGLAAEIVDDLWFGARTTNLNQPSYGDTDEELSRELAAGISYMLTSEALITAEIVKDVLFPLSFRSGVQFEIIQSLFIRAGITTKPETYSFGFGYQSRNWNVNVGLQQHNPLGLSPALDLAVKF